MLRALNARCYRVSFICEVLIVRNVGIGLLLLGVVLMLVGVFTDTTVDTGNADAFTGMLSRVHNMGLMAKRQLLMDLGQHSTLLGVLLVGFAKVAAVVDSGATLTERRLLEVAEQLRRAQPRP